MKRTKKSSPPTSARLFAEGHPAPPPGVYLANIDGASRGNPGPAAYAIILRTPDGATVCKLGKYIGSETNNVAEYYGLLAALDYAASHGIRALRIRSDSELLVRQMQGRYKVKSAVIKPLHERAQKLAHALEYFAIEHVPRGANHEADALANSALDRTSGMHNSSSAEARTGTKGPQNSSAARRIWARYSGGKLVPAEPLGLPEGDSVEIDIHIPKKI